ncbi:hypothetical protein [Natrialbaceae archaeon AArc-T1-2]|nr:hypothetical protein [Natrialbaceae archaeon AArc-T1-2]WIV66513.1 hypothetical protein QQ977_12535 [Natrialbaceae archaeon AArc-T1-2]
MAIHQHTELTFRCPDCDGAVVFEYGSWQCEDCGHAPRHGAD